MKKGILRLLAGLLALAAAWNLSRLAAALLKEGQAQTALRQAISETEEAVARKKEALDALSPEGGAEQALRRSGFISRGDIVFFDGG